MRTSSVLGEFHATFLAEYWQRKPLLLRQAFPGGLDAIDGDELAGLACSEGVESRLVLEKGAKPWEMRQGPFSDQDFRQLPESHWTLLVQAVDRLVPEVSALRRHFSFIPNWRMDDVMISFAADQGSVGPHTDNYDVFLIQGRGRRRWEIGTKPLEDPELLSDLDMKILKHFEAEQSWVLEPGDMLYIPPRFAHHGVALGESITYSIGFRAPTQRDMLLSYIQFLSQHLSEDVFYRDPSLELGREPARILSSELEGLWALMQQAWNQPHLFHRWVGGFLTEPRSFHETAQEPRELKEFATWLAEGDAWEWAEGVNVSYFTEEGTLYFAAEGETLVLKIELMPLVQLLCSEASMTSLELLAFRHLDGAGSLLLHLYNEGLLRPVE